jgi:hypothetical protein
VDLPEIPDGHELCRHCKKTHAADTDVQKKKQRKNGCLGPQLTESVRKGTPSPNKTGMRERGSDGHASKRIRYNINAEIGGLRATGERMGAGSRQLGAGFISGYSSGAPSTGELKCIIYFRA